MGAGHDRVQKKHQDVLICKFKILQALEVINSIQAEIKKQKIQTTRTQ